MLKKFLIDEYLKNKKSINEISKGTDCSRETIRRNLIKFNIPRRSKSQKGEKANNYIDGRTLKKYFCIDCDTTVHYHTACYNQGRCLSCSVKEKHKIGIINVSGKNNPNWKNGLSFSAYPSEFNNELKVKIRKRDNYTCQKCNITEEEHLIVYGCNLSVHHIDYNKKNCKEENLITLCSECNLRANFNRDYWEKYFKEKVIIPIKKGKMNRRKDRINLFSSIGEKEAGINRNS